MCGGVFGFGVRGCYGRCVRIYERARLRLLCNEISRILPLAAIAFSLDEVLVVLENKL